VIDRDSIKEAINALIERNFSGGAVASVDISFADDDFDSAIVNVKIILNKQVDRSSLSRFGLKLRNALNDLESDRFPVVSFIAKNEYERRAR
jgi:hypothetical protein